MPLVTVFIPNYNHAKFLNKRIDSVLNQSFQDFQVVILDDGSNDKSMEVVNQYRGHSKVISIEYNPSNSGSVFIQWAKAIKLCETDFLWIAESDDYAHQDFLSVTVANITKHPDLGMVFTNSTYVDMEGSPITSPPDYPVLDQLKMNEHGRITEKSHMIGGLFINHLAIANVSAVLFRREALKSIDFAQLKQFKNAGDLFTYLQVLFGWEIGYINQSMNFFRQHDHNITRLNRKTGILQLERIWIIIYFFDRLVSVPNSYKFLRHFLKRHLLPALDHGLHKDVKQLLNTYRKHNILSSEEYQKLKAMTLLARFERLKNSTRLRDQVKSALSISNSDYGR